MLLQNLIDRRRPTARTIRLERDSLPDVAGDARDGSRSMSEPFSVLYRQGTG
jgi:hypothetical protein